MGALGQFQNGPIQFNDDTGAIEARGTRPPPSATTAPAAPRAPSGDRMPPQVNVQPTDETGGAPTAPGNDTSYTPPGGALGSSFDSGDDGDQWKPGDFRSPIDPQPFGALDGKPFGNTIQWNSPFGGGLNGLTVGHFEDGGEVDGGEEQQAADPISVIKQALNFGRKKMGLPTNFTDGTSEQDEGQVMGFEDGGVIPEQGQPDEGAPSEGGSGLADPRKTIAYLAGDGAVSPEIAQALEQHVDPDGSMDPSERTMATLNAAPDDESKFGMLQHYRTKYNGYSAGARAAMDQGNLGLAAKHATDAFDAVPTGQKISFAPAGGGNIAVILKNAIDGARKFAGAGILGKAPIKAGDDAWQKFHGGGEEVPAMEDGGEFEEDPTEVRDDATEVTGSVPQQAPVRSDGGSAGVLADHEAEGAEVDRQYAEQQARGPQPRSDGGSAGVLADHAAEGAALDAEPMILNKEQFKRLMTSGYDKPLDDGVKGTFEHIMDAVASAMGPGAAQAQGLPRDNPAYAQPGKPSMGMKGYATQGQPDAAPAPKRTPIDDTNDRMENYQKRVEALAEKLFPWASQTNQRNQYVADAMEKVLESEGKVDQVSTKNQGDQKLASEQFKQSQITARSEATRQSKWDMEMAKLDAKSANLRLQELGKVVRTEMLNHPNASAQDIAAKFGAPVSVVNQLLSQPVSSGAQGGAPGGGAPVPGGEAPASSTGPREGDTRPYTVKGVTKQYKFQNGQWRRQD